MIVRGRQFEEIELRLARYCVDRSIPRRTRWLLFGNGISVGLRQLFRPRYLARVIRFGIRVGKPRIIFLPSGTRRFFVKNHMRLMRVAPTSEKERPRKAFSIKIGLPSDYRSGSLAREIATRRFLSRQNLSKLSPVLLAYDRLHGGWLEEEWIDVDQSADPAAKVSGFIGHHAYSFYRPFARSRPVEEFLARAGIFVDEIEATLNAGGGAPIRIAGQTWPVAFRHGDLSPGNMLMDRGGRLFVVDWEEFGRAPIAADLASLYTSKHVSNRTAICQLLVSLGQPGDADPEVQMRIAFAVRLMLLRRDRVALQKNLQESFSTSAKIAAARADKMESQYRALAAGG
jgi:hypothetical protein